MVATCLYRNALKNIDGLSHDTAMLFPETIVVASTVLIFFGQVTPAFLLLVGGKLIMAVTVVVLNTYRLCHYSVENTASSKELSAKESII